MLTNIAILKQKEDHLYLEKAEEKSVLIPINFSFQSGYDDGNETLWRRSSKKKRQVIK
jgi:hypothetical protein